MKENEFGNLYKSKVDLTEYVLSSYKNYPESSHYYSDKEAMFVYKVLFEEEMNWFLPVYAQAKGINTRRLIYCLLREKLENSNTIKEDIKLCLDIWNSSEIKGCRVPSRNKDVTEKLCKGESATEVAKECNLSKTMVYTVRVETVCLYKNHLKGKSLLTFYKNGDKLYKVEEPYNSLEELDIKPKYINALKRSGISTIDDLKAELTQRGQLSDHIRGIGTLGEELIRLSLSEWEQKNRNVL